MRLLPVSISIDLLVVTATLLAQPVAAQKRQPHPAVGLGAASPIAPPRVFFVKGWVAEARSHTRIERVRVELHAVTGPIVGQTFTGGNGDFEFDNIPAGTYNLVVAPMGYETVSQPVELRYGPALGIEVEVGRPAETVTPVEGGSKVSVRELSIPKKAHDAMEKGMSLLYKKSNYQGSIKEFQRAIDAYADYYEAYAFLGVAYEKLGDVSASEQALRKSVDISGGNYQEALCLLAALLSDQGRFADAEPVARKAVDLDPGSWQAQSALGKALLGLNRNKEAETNAAAAVKIEPDNATLHLILANIHIRLQNYEALLDDLNAYIQLDPKGPFAEQARRMRDDIKRAAPSEASPATLSTATH